MGTYLWKENERTALGAWLLKMTLQNLRFSIDLVYPQWAISTQLVDW